MGVFLLSNRYYLSDYVDKPLEKPLKLVLKVGGSEVTELSGSGHDSSYYDDRSDLERERHKEKKKKKKKKSEKEKDKHVDEEERRRRKEEKKRKREREQCDTEGEVEGASTLKMEVKSVGLRGEGLIHCRYYGHGSFVGPVLMLKGQILYHSGRQMAAHGPNPGRAVSKNDCTPLQQLLEHFLRQLQRKDPHGFFSFPVTDAIAPGYSMIIKHPMDFSTIKDKIEINEYKSVTEFKADFKLMCDNAMVYNRPETVYYKAAKKLLHTGFKMMSKERLLALKRSMSFMQDMDFSQQAAILGNEDTATEEPVPEVIPVPVEPTKKSKKPVKDMNEVVSYLYEPEGTACSLTDSTAEEHVLALVEHAADEARDRIHRHLPSSKIGYLKKDADGALVYTVVNQSDPETEAATHWSWSERRNIAMKPPDETKTSLCDMQVGDAAGMAEDSNNSVLDFMSMKSYSDMSLDMSMLHTLGSPGHLSVGEQAEMVHDPYEFLQSPEPGSTANS
ncbi:UNVERIFIED_CONTAM: hypothetical protein FKN15_016861 [Acipenser sinensis]